MLFPTNYHKAALLGTNKASNLGSTGYADLDAMLAKVPGQNAEAFWSKLTTIYFYLQTKSSLEVQEPSHLKVFEENEGLRPLPDNLKECLSLLLRDQFNGAWLEFLNLVKTGSYRIPAEYLPNLLDRAEKYPELTENILGVVGERGKWLMAQHMEWQKLSPNVHKHAPSEDSWKFGDPDQREIYLKYWRDKDPAKARESLMSTWKKEKADDRHNFLQILETGLSLEDEEFLESVLKDKSEKVRLRALRILSKLPESRLGQEIVGFWKKSLNLKKPILGKQFVETVWPTEVGEFELLAPFISIQGKFYEDRLLDLVIDFLSLECFYTLGLEVEDFLPLLLNKPSIGLYLRLTQSVYEQKNPEWAEVIIKIFLNKEYGLILRKIVSKKAKKTISHKMVYEGYLLYLCTLETQNKFLLQITQDVIEKNQTDYDFYDILEWGSQLTFPPELPQRLVVGIINNFQLKPRNYWDNSQNIENLTNLTHQLTVSTLPSSLKKIEFLISQLAEVETESNLNRLQEACRLIEFRIKMNQHLN